MLLTKDKAKEILTFSGEPNKEVLNAGLLVTAGAGCLLINESLKRLLNV